MSKLDINGQLLVHRLEARPEHLQLLRCTVMQHGPTVTGCRCQCTEAGCTTKRTVKHWCAAHKNPLVQYEFYFQNHGEHGYRMWNRDVIGALNIG